MVILLQGNQLFFYYYSSGVDFIRTEPNIYKRNDGRWEARYFKEYDSNGKRKYISLYAKTYREVKEKLKSVSSEFSNSSKNINIDFNSLCYDWLNSNKEKIKITTYSRYMYMINKYIAPCFKGKKLYQINKNCIELLVAFNYRLSTKSQRDILSLFKTIIKYINQNFDTKIKPNEYIFNKCNKNTISVISIPEQKRLEKYLLYNTDLKKLGVFVCLYTGIRIGEICALKWSDIDLYNNTIKINKTIQRIFNPDSNSNTKTKVVICTPKSECSIRDIPIPEFISNILKQYQSSGYFLTVNNKYIEPRSYRNIFKRYIKDVRINNTNFHSLRHTFATRAIENGIDIKSLSEILGHASINITLEKYVHPSMEQKRIQLDKLKDFYES